MIEFHGAERKEILGKHPDHRLNNYVSLRQIHPIFLPGRSTLTEGFDSELSHVELIFPDRNQPQRMIVLGMRDELDVLSEVDQSRNIPSDKISPDEIIHEGGFVPQ